MGGSRGGHTIGGQPTAHLGNLKELLSFLGGTGSGIDVDTVDGKHASDFVPATDVVTTASASKILKLDANSKLPASITGNADGNAATATKLQTARTITLAGDITGSVSFDGSGNVSITTTYKNSGVTAGTYTKVTVDAKGNITSGTSMSNADVVSSLGYTPVNKAGDTMTGFLTLHAEPSGVMTATPRQYVDKRANYVATNAFNGNTPADSYFDTAFELMKVNGNNGTWPAAAGLVITHTPIFDSYPGSIQQLFYGEGTNDVWQRRPSVTKAYNGVTNWSASKAVSLNALGMPASVNGNGYYYKCTTAGTTGTTEPTWTTTINGTITDGTVVWTNQGKMWTDWDRLLTAGTVTASMIPSLDWSKITSGKPTTLAGYGITNGMRTDANTSTTGSISAGTTITAGGDITSNGILKCGKSTWQVTFAPGEMRKTVAHSIGTANYMCATGANSTARHASWENKATTTIDIVLDSPYYDGTILVDVILIGY